MCFLLLPISVQAGLLGTVINVDLEALRILNKINEFGCSVVVIHDSMKRLVYGKI